MTLAAALSQGLSLWAFGVLAILSWVQGWCICFALILGVGRLAAKRRPPNNS